MSVQKRPGVQPGADVDLLGWTHGPLPDQALEQIALKVFQRQYPVAAWADPLFSPERNDARRFTLALRVEFLRHDRWTLDTMVDRLQEGFGRIVFGDRGASAPERTTLRAYARECLQGLFARFSGDKHPMVLPDAETHTWAIPHGQGISEQWQQSYVATKFAEVLAALGCPGVPLRSMDAQDRAWLRSRAEAMVDDTVARFNQPVQQEDSLENR
jgi:hypothetical protein